MTGKIGPLQILFIRKWTVPQHDSWVSYSQAPALVLADWMSFRLNININFEADIALISIWLKC